MFIRLKSSNEIEKFAQVGQIAAKIMRILKEKVKPGIFTKDLNLITIELCNEYEVIPTFLGYNGFPAAICTSVNNELVHGIPNDRRLAVGDLLKIDLGVTLNGFIGDVAETVVVGQPETKLLSDCRLALEKAIVVAKPGGDLGDIGEVIWNIAKRNGWKAVRNYGGHGIDIGKLHVDPFVYNQRVESLKLRPGMIFAIEPMFVDAIDDQTKKAADNWTVEAGGLAAHFEHTIAITESGPLILTKEGVV